LPLYTLASQGNLSCNALPSYSGDMYLCPLKIAFADVDDERELFHVALKENFGYFDCSSFSCYPSHSL
jgi:hypothetical protein